MWGWERPLGSRAQMLSFCFLNILPRTCETLYLFLLVFGEKESISWIP